MRTHSALTVAAYCQPARHEPWSGTPEPLARTIMGLARTADVGSFTATVLRAGSGWVRSWRSQPLPRSETMRGLGAKRAAPTAPDAAISRMLVVVNRFGALLAPNRLTNRTERPSTGTG